jgi:polyhydroxybutyrate depolymerase
MPAKFPHGQLRRCRLRWLAFLMLALSAMPAWACGAGSDCALGDRSYRIHLPADKDGAIGAIIFVHGWRGTAAGVMANTSLIALADELGVALVAPQAVGDGWQLPGRPRNRDNTGKEEFAYFRELVDELERRFSIDRKKLLVSGFSSGGMMVWNLACHEGGLFAGFAPIAGTFWSPIPDSCPSRPVDLIHFHGTGDTMVPLTGRAIADGKQGEVPKALALFGESGGFGPAIAVPADGLLCERRENPQGRILEFCTHPGNHIYKADYVRRAWQQLRIGGS